MSDFKSKYTSAEIEALLDKAQGAAPANGATLVELINSAIGNGWTNGDGDVVEVTEFPSEPSNLLEIYHTIHECSYRFLADIGWIQVSGSGVGKDGDGLYETWLAEGNHGTKQDFLDYVIATSISRSSKYMVATGTIELNDGDSHYIFVAPTEGDVEVMLPNIPKISKTFNLYNVGALANQYRLKVKFGNDVLCDLSPSTNSVVAYDGITWRAPLSIEDSDTVVKGIGAIASGSGVALGNTSNGNLGGVAVGENADASATGVSIGKDSDGHTSGSAVGNNASAINYGVSVGKNADGSSYGVSLGVDSDASNGGVAVGANSEGYNNGVSVGINSDANNKGAGVGDDIDAWNQGAGIGAEADVTNEGAGVGYQVVATNESTAMGSRAKASQLGVAIGHRSNTNDHGAAFAKGTRSMCERYQEEWRCANPTDISISHANRVGTGHVQYYGKVGSTLTELFLGETVGERFTLKPRSVVSFTMNILVTDDTATTCEILEVRGAVKTGLALPGTTQLVGVPVLTPIASDGGFTSTVEVTADSQHGALGVKVKTNASSDMYVSASMTYNERRFI